MALDLHAAEYPRYRVLDAKGFFADNHTLYPQGTELTWLGPPNELMEPLNDAAVDRMTEYLAELDRWAEIKAKLDGRAAARSIDLGDAVLQAMLDRPKAPPRKMPVRGDAPARPDMMTKEQKRAALAKSQVMGVVPVETGRSTVRRAPPGPPGPIPILGTTYTGDAQHQAR